MRPHLGQPTLDLSELGLDSRPFLFEPGTPCPHLGVGLLGRLPSLDLGQESIERRPVAAEPLCRAPPLQPEQLVKLRTLQGDGSIALPSGQHPVSYTHLRAHETDSYLVCRLLL